jgi:hypothetical protein
VVRYDRFWPISDVANRPEADLRSSPKQSFDELGNYRSGRVKAKVEPLPIGEDRKVDP